ncbi:hypothetical protein CK203_018753 [Vitis vinifera]|uniref:Uncharacterized protein n=1 Tax=Vitis vinifera TaxID=29760 RepID=A0A438JAT8_VITVI|nr:hypothetical protein CK203_018753 [Vitis vinifera]
MKYWKVWISRLIEWFRYYFFFSKAVLLISGNLNHPAKPFAIAKDHPAKKNKPGEKKQQAAPFPLHIAFLFLKAAIIKRRLPYPGALACSSKNDGDEVILLPNIPFFRWLDKAAIVDPSFLSPEEHEMQGKLCSVAQVKEIKSLLKMVPMWATFLVLSMVEIEGVDSDVEIRMSILCSGNLCFYCYVSYWYMHGEGEAVHVHPSTTSDDGHQDSVTSHPSNGSPSTSLSVDAPKLLKFMVAFEVEHQCYCDFLSIT